MPASPDDPEITRRLSGLNWEPGQPIPSMTRLAAYGVIRDDGKLLLCRVGPGNLGEGRWTLPGGGLEFGEAPEAAVVREVEEETGLVARITGAPVIHSDSGNWPFSDGTVRYHTVRFVYPMAIVGGSARPEVGGSTDDFGWFEPDELGGMLLADLVERVIASG